MKIIMSWKAALLLCCLICLLTLSACAQAPTPTPSPIPAPTIVPAHPCTLKPGETIPLVVTGIAGSEIKYQWSASAGMVIPPDNPTVTFTAPETAGDVIIKVVAQKDEQTSEGIITCNVIAIPTVTPTYTLAPTDTLVPTPTETIVPTFTPSPCQGSSSPELIGKAWKAWGENDAEMTLACVQVIIANWSADADKMQSERIAANTCESAVPSNPRNAQAVQNFNAKYWALNDVATAWFLSGEALTKLGQQKEAREAYQTVITKYSCGYAWDPKGPWFWNVADAARKK